MSGQGGDGEKAILSRKNFLIFSIILAYTVAWYLGLKDFLSMKPFPSWALEDYGYYADAFQRTMAGGDPYEIRQIGLAYLYPPQALFLVGIFEALPSDPIRIAAYWAVSAGLLALIIHLSQRFHGTRLSGYSFALLLFLPFWVGTYIGQINIFVATLMAGYFVCLRERPALAGTFLAVAVALKVTPGLLILLAFRYRWRVTLAAFVGVSAVLALAAGAFFGFDTLLTYLDVAGSMSQKTTFGSEKLSVLNVFYIVAVSQGLDTGAIITLQPFVWALALLACLIALVGGRRRDETGTITFAVMVLALTTAPNIVWLHHFTFFLPAACLILAYPPNGLAVLAVLVALAGIQIGPIVAPANWNGLFLQGGTWSSIILLLASIWWRPRALDRGLAPASRDEPRV